MKTKSIKKIESNPNLVVFCNRIMNYNAIFENEMVRSMFFVSLISSDCLIDIHSCDETIEISNFILSHIDLFMLEDDLRKNPTDYAGIKNPKEYLQEASKIIGRKFI